MKKKNILVGVRYYTKDGTSINFPGEVINFDFNTCKYRFAFITSHKYLHYKKFKFDKGDDLVIEYKDGKAKIVKF